MELVKVSARQRADGVVVVSCAGKLTIANGADAVYEAVFNLVQMKKKKIALDFTDVVYVDLSIFGILMGARQTVLAEDGEFAILNCRPRVVQTLRKSKLYDLLGVVASMAPTRELSQPMHMVV